MLIRSDRITPRDAAAWARWEKSDEMFARANRGLLEAMADRAMAKMAEFFKDRRGYIGVSWGKDSIVVADLAARAGIDVPLVPIRCEPLVNPDCDLVRDKFRSIHPTTRIDEIEVWARPDPGDEDGWHQSGTLEAGFKEAGRRHGKCYASGIRGQESPRRMRRMMAFGTASVRTLAPIGWWKTEHVFAYIHMRGLPLHPAYAMTMGGVYDRMRMRVAFLTLRCGEWAGSREWERQYYGDRLDEIRAMAGPATKGNDNG